MKQSTNIMREEAILEQIKNSLTIFETVIDKRKQRHQVIYASSPITGGKRLYEQFKKNGVNSLPQLNKIQPDLYKKAVFQKNIADGVLFGNELRKTNGAVIVPGNFFAQGWTQEHYMSLWENVIIRYADSITINDEWEFSNGCAQELLIGLQYGIPVLQRNTQTPIAPQEAIKKLARAIEYIDKIGAETNALYTIYREIVLRSSDTQFSQYHRIAPEYQQNK